MCGVSIPIHDQAYEANWDVRIVECVVAQRGHSYAVILSTLDDTLDDGGARC